MTSYPGYPPPGGNPPPGPPPWQPGGGQYPAPPPISPPNTQPWAPGQPVAQPWAPGPPASPPVGQPGGQPPSVPPALTWHTGYQQAPPPGPPGPPLFPMAPPPAKPGRGPLIAVLVVAAVVILGLGGFFIVKATQSGPGKLNTDAALATFTSLADDEKPDSDGYVGSESSCTIADYATITAKAPADVSIDADESLDVFKPGRSGEDPLIYQCSKRGDTAQTGFLWGVAADGSQHDYVERNYDDGHDSTDFGQAGTLRGGSVLRYCEKYSDKSLIPFCEADWTDGQIQIGVYSSELTMDQAYQWLDDSLASLVDAANALKPGDLHLTTS